MAGPYRCYPYRLDRNGNIIGEVSLVAALGHAQVVGRKEA